MKVLLNDSPFDVVEIVKRGLAEMTDDDEPVIPVVVADDAGDRFGEPPIFGDGYQVARIVVVVEPHVHRVDVNPNDPQYGHCAGCGEVLTKAESGWVSAR